MHLYLNSKKSLELKYFKLAVENASDQIVITNSEGVVIYANKSIKRVTGYSQKEVVGTKAGRLWGGLMPKSYYSKMWKTIKVDKKVFKGQVKNKKKNGVIYTAEIHITPVLEESGEIMFFVSLERDITKIIELNDAKEEFITLASHQLRTPLSAINWYTEMLVNGDVGILSNKQFIYLKEIQKCNTKMVGLVNTLINVSKLEMDTFVVSKSEVNLEEIIKDIILELTPVINKKRISIIPKYVGNIRKIFSDPKVLDIVIENLITNAIKYSKYRGQVNILIKIVKDKLFIVVKDKGIGILQKDKDKIFTKMFRATNAKNQDAEGTGLGLYTVKSVLKKVGGEIKFTSVSNEGATFYVAIPIK